ncbi:glycoside hydrolase family 97 protein [Maribacter litoralis]|uniref:Alpha-glucosidase n=1 Tax=Maribacter litoralis TaxID=2059726 RepID=A0A653MD23_9FLAO|nr:glycoside hydrolase family 97 protein [Maribacter litoralis]VXB02007.1 Alpha-glucosidase [Maribacter litoralis]
MPRHSTYKISLCTLLLFVLTLSCSNVSEYSIASPNGKNVFTVFPDYSKDHSKGLSFDLRYEGEPVLLPSTLELITDELDFKGDWSILRVDEQNVQSSWTTKFGELSEVPDNYQEIKIHLQKGNSLINIIARAYDEGVAFSYEIPEQANIDMLELDEKIHYNFDKDHMLWSTPKREKGVLTAQGEYKKIPMSQLETGIERPLLIEIKENLKIALAEANLVDYARLSYSKNTSSDNSIMSSLDGKMEEGVQDTITGALISERKNDVFKVKRKLPFQSPWRVIMMAENEGELLEHNYIIQNLNEPSKLKDDSWVTPGKALREATLTTEGGMVAIDFVVDHNMQYVLFDAGWYGNEMYEASDATTITLDPKRSKGPFDIEAITSYAKEKGIGIILYVNRRALEKQLDEILPLYKKWGIAGIKFGFVRVGDQEATAWLHSAIKKASDYGFIVDVHDEYRPTGFSRTYPNLLTQEGIEGDEESPTNEQTLNTMFTRMLAGAADNTVCYYNSRVNKMGSHASQLAKTVCLFSPLQLLYWYDKPASSLEKNDGLWGDTKHIGNEPELEFFDAVPTTWDDTKVLHAKIGEIGVIARRKGSEWFVGGINGNSAQQLQLDFSFLNEEETYTAKLYTDDETVESRTKVKIEAIQITNSNTREIALKPNNGFTMHIVPTSEIKK